jgi:hypothetical protein
MRISCGCFAQTSESIQHLFFYCHFARFIWRAVQVTFNNDTYVCDTFI